MITVICPDGHIRHEPFPNMRLADDWAYWDHFCYGQHKFIESAVVEPA